VENKNSNVEIDMAEEAHNNGNNNDGDGGNEEDGRNESNRDEVTHMEVEQTMNPGTNQGGVGENRNNANVKHSSLMVTFGTFPPSSINEEVSMPCVFTVQPGVPMNSEGTEKNLSQNRVQILNLDQVLSQPQNDKTGAGFEEDFVPVPVPIVGCSSIIEPRASSSSAVRSQWEMRQGDRPAAVPAAPVSPMLHGLLDADPAEAASPSFGDTRRDMAGTKAGSSVKPLQPQANGSSAPHNGVVNAASEVTLEKILTESYVSIKNLEVNLVILNEQLCEEIRDDISASNPA
jgi:hypothetical protein